MCLLDLLYFLTNAPSLPSPVSTTLQLRIPKTITKLRQMIIERKGSADYHCAQQNLVTAHDMKTS